MTDEKPVVPMLPWTWAPPARVMAKVADKLGLPDTPAGVPSFPFPVRVAMWFCRMRSNG